jgi:hypothetical protein
VDAANERKTGNKKVKIKLTKEQEEKIAKAAPTNFKERNRGK